MGQFSEAFRKVQKSISASAGRVFEDDSMSNARAMTAALAGSSRRREAGGESPESLATSIEQMKDAVIASTSISGTDNLTTAIERLVESTERLTDEQKQSRKQTEKETRTPLFTKEDSAAKATGKGKGGLTSKERFLGKKAPVVETKGIGKVIGGVIGKALGVIGIAGVLGKVAFAWSEGKFEKQRELARYSSSIHSAFAKLERSDIQRGFEKAGKTGASTERAAASRIAADRAMVNFQADMTNLGNNVYDSLQAVREVGGNIYSWVTGQEATDFAAGVGPAAAYGEFLKNMAAGWVGPAGFGPPNNLLPKGNAPPADN